MRRSCTTASGALRKPAVARRRSGSTGLYAGGGPGVDRGDDEPERARRARARSAGVPVVVARRSGRGPPAYARWDGPPPPAVPPSCAVPPLAPAVPPPELAPALPSPISRSSLASAASVSSSSDSRRSRLFERCVCALRRAGCCGWRRVEELEERRSVGCCCARAAEEERRDVGGGCGGVRGSEGEVGLGGEALGEGDDEVGSAAAQGESESMLVWVLLVGELVVAARGVCEVRRRSKGEPGRGRGGGWRGSRRAQAGRAGARSRQ